jgi:hypothetical protein
MFEAFDEAAASKAFESCQQMLSYCQRPSGA